MAFKVFVSHSMAQEDLGIVYEAARQARSKEIDCYIAERDWQFGKSLPKKIETAIRACDCFVAFWTAGGSHSAYVNQEIGFARACQKLRIFVVERGVALKGFDIDKEYIELSRYNPFEAIRTLSEYLSGLKAEKEQRDSAAIFLLGAIGLLLIVSGKGK